MVLILAVLGCGSDHLMLATTIQVEDLGDAANAPNSAPVVAPDGVNVIYLKAVNTQSSVGFPVMFRNRTTLADDSLFAVPPGSTLCTYDYASGTLLFSVADGTGGARHIVDFALNGIVRMSYDVPAGYQDYHGAMSPNGLQLAFVRRSDANGLQQVMVRDASSGTSTTRSLGTLINNETVRAVRWIDTNRLLVSSMVPQGAENFVWDVPSGLRSTLIGLGFSTTPDPSGQRVAFLGQSSGAADLYLSRLNGEATTRLTSSATAKESLTWSLDGSAIAYEIVRPQLNVSALEVVVLPPLK